ncbi:MAG: DUF2828 family protein [bacterium]
MSKSKLLKEMEKSTNKTARTENGALSYKNTLNSVLDFFSKSGALRGQEEEVVRYFDNAISEDLVMAMRAMFYMRDIRGGQGERENFRKLLKFTAKNFPAEMRRNMVHVPEFGRWDDMYAFVGTPLEADAFAMISVQFIKDLDNLKSGQEVSLLGKWLKSENTSSKTSRELATKTRNYLGLSSRKYRKALSMLRKQIGIVERAMSAKKWENINFEHVPSQASRIYSNAFREHQPERYSEYMEQVKSGEKKINASTLYPYDIARKILSESIYGFASSSSYDEEAYDALWKALPNYIPEGESGLVVADTSGSMFSGHGSNNVRPIDVSVSLALYFAERAKGRFKDYFITFSDEPSLKKVKGSTIASKIRNISKAEWGASTNLQAVFSLILKTAIANELSQEDLPSKIFIISDMQFNHAIKSGGGRFSEEKTNFEAIEKKFKKAGYKRPDLVFWNVNASSDTPVTQDEKGTFLVSGCSPSILKHAINCEATTPVDLMVEVLSSPRYAVIQ